MSEEHANVDPIQKLLDGLKANKASDRLAAVESLQSQNELSADSISSLENAALNDNAANVREAAMKALDARVSKLAQRKRNKLSFNNRRMIAFEIEKWRADGLIADETAQILKKRYSFDFASAQSIQTARQEPEKSKEPQPKRSMSEVLLSESSIKTVLYLGAFFVLAAASIFSSIFEVLRIPILFIVTIGFLLAAIGLKKRMHQASFVMFLIYSVLIPLDANIIQDSLNIRSPFDLPFWLVVTLFLLLNWGAATWFFKSRFFSLMSFIALTAIPFILAEWFGLGPQSGTLLIFLANLVALGGIFLLRRWQDEKFATPLLGVSQLWQLFILTIGLRATSEAGTPLEWVLVVLIWLSSSMYYLASNRYKAFFAYPFLAVLNLMAAAFAMIATFEFNETVNLLVIWLWGLVFAIGSELLRKMEEWKHYTLPLLLASFFMFFVAFAISLSSDEITPYFGFFLMLFSTILYAILNVREPRQLVWLGNTTSILAAYINFLNLPFFDQQNFSEGLILLWPALGYLTGEWLARVVLKAERAWHFWPRLFGSFFTFFAFMALLDGISNDAGHSMTGFLIMAIFFGLYAWLSGYWYTGYIATASLTLSFTALLSQQDIESPLLYIEGIALVFFLLGEIPQAFKRQNAATQILRVSGIALSIFMAILAPGDGVGRTVLFTQIAVIVLFSDSLMQVLFPNDTQKDQLKEKSTLAAIWDSVGSLLLKLAIGFYSFGSMIIYGVDEPLYTAVAFLIYTAFFLLYALLMNSPDWGYLAIGSLAFSGGYLSEAAGWQSFLGIELGLVLAMMIGGLLPIWKESPWQRVLRNSALGLGLLISLVGLIEGEAIGVITIAAVATLFAIEAFRLKAVGFAILADFLYLFAYLLVLNELNVDQPQFFSIGTALLGMIMHYMLWRSGSGGWAFIAGLLSQLVLLSTSYIQMISTGRLLFFFILFFQALVVVAYGLVVRSRSLVIVPVAFIVLGVITVLFSALSGLAALIMIGCTGFLLLAAGVGALFMRERISAASSKVKERLEDWSA